MLIPFRDHNPSERRPVVTHALIVINIVIFAATWWLAVAPSALNQLYYDYALIPARLTAGENPTALVTSMFLHGGIMHLLGNMLFLFIFGDNLEDEMGHMPFLIFYLASGIAAAFAQYAADTTSQIPTIGASGAIAGVMGGYLLLFPKARIDVLFFFVIFFRVFAIPAVVVLVFWFTAQLLGGLGSVTDEGGVAYWAHAGGFVVGLIGTIPLWMRRGGPRYWTRTEGHPPHPEAENPFSKSSIPIVRRRK